MLSAFSVATFMATIRAICSLTAASRKHLNSRTLESSSAPPRPECSRPRAGTRTPAARAFVAASSPSARSAMRQQRLDHGVLPAGALELRVDHVQPVDGAVEIILQVAGGQHVDLGEARLVLEVGERLGERRLAEAEGRDAPLAGDFQRAPRALPPCNRPYCALASAKDAGVVAAAQPAVGREHQQDRPARLGPRPQQRMRDFQRRCRPGGPPGPRSAACRPSPPRPDPSPCLNWAVEISSIVRVILRMLRIDLRRRSSARALAMGERGQWSVVSGPLSVVRCQWSVVSGPLSVVSCQWSVRRTAVLRRPPWAEGPWFSQPRATPWGTRTQRIPLSAQRANRSSRRDANGWSVGPIPHQRTTQNTAWPRSPGRCPGLGEPAPLRGNERAKHHANNLIPYMPLVNLSVMFGAKGTKVLLKCQASMVFRLPLDVRDHLVDIGLAY